VGTRAPAQILSDIAGRSGEDRGEKNHHGETLVQPRPGEKGNEPQRDKENQIVAGEIAPFPELPGRPFQVRPSHRLHLVHHDRIERFQQEKARHPQDRSRSDHRTPPSPEKPKGADRGSPKILLQLHYGIAERFAREASGLLFEYRYLGAAVVFHPSSRGQRAAQEDRKGARRVKKGAMTNS